MNTLRISLTGLVLASLLAAPLAFADNGKGKNDNDDRRRGNDKAFFLPFSVIGTTTSALQEQIKALQAALEQLKKERSALDNNRDNRDERRELKEKIEDKKDEIRDAEKQLKFVRSLTRGMSGDDVRDLQELLAQDPEIFSSLYITGFFGPKTEEAVRKFQRKHGIEALGIFGPKTQAKLLSLFAGRELPPGIAKRLGIAFGTTTPGTGLVTICHKPAGTNPVNLVIAVPALGAHMGHGDSVGFCPGTATTTPPIVDTTAPNISNVGVTNLTSSGATINWTTNENATSKIYYSTTSPVNLPTAQTVTNSTLVTNHSMTLSGLNSGTTYHFVIESKDASNNTATTTSQLTTAIAADTTAPSIFNVGISGISSTTATLSWTTNENATGKVYYSTTSPINFATALTSGTTTLSTAHSFSLTGLSAATTYHYVLVSSDASNNTATTTAGAFVTTN